MGNVNDMAREKEQPPTLGWGKKPLTTMRPLAGVNSNRLRVKVIVVVVVVAVVVLLGARV